MLRYALQFFPSNQIVLNQIRLKGSNWIGFHFGFWVESIIQYDAIGSCPDLNINTILLFQQNRPMVVWYDLFDHGRPFLSLIPLSAECLRAISDKLGCTPICSQICKKTPIFDEAPSSLSCHLSGAAHYCYDKYENHLWMEALQKSDATLDDFVQSFNISLLSRMGRRRGPIP